MIALSVRQPWAWLIVNGHKTVDNRTWRTSYRGPLLIHASQTLDMTVDELDGVRQALAEIGIDMPPTLLTGGIVGCVNLIDCTLTPSPNQDPEGWHDQGYWAWVVTDAEPLPFRPMPGRLHLFEVAYEETTNG